MTYDILKYVSEKQRELNQHIHTGKNLLITSPTDSGKTTAMLKLKDEFRSKRIAFVMPTQNLVRNLKSKTSVPCGYGREFAKEYRFEKFVCTTYDTCLKFEKGFDIIIIDEAHLLAGQGNFRTEVLANLLDSGSQIVLLTGTPAIVENLEGFEVISFNKSKPVREVLIHGLQTNAVRTIHKLIEQRNPHNLLLIRVNNKQTIDEIHELYKNELDIYKLYSDSDEVLCTGQNEAIVNEIKNGNIPQSVGVLLTTSIIDAGITLKVFKNVDCYAISESYMPNPIDVIQLQARVRSISNYKLTLNVIGRYGVNGYLKDYSLKSATTHQLVKLMNFHYQQMCELDESSYTKLLGSHSLKAVQVVSKSTGKVKRYVGGVRDVTIVKNLNSFLPEFVSLKEMCKGKPCEDWLEYFKGGEDIFSEANSRVKRIFELISFAQDNNIHPSMYLDNSFNSLKLEALNYAVESFNHSRSFRAVVVELLAGMDSESFTFNNSGYHDLSMPHQKAVRTFAGLLYEGNKWGRATQTLKRKATSIEINLYLNNFTWLLQQVA